MTDNSIFNSGGSDQELSNEIEGLKTRYVKADGNFDIDGLLKAKAHADRHIKNIETEQAGLRDDLKARATLEDLMAQIKEAANQGNSVQQGSHQENTPASDVDINKLVDDKFNTLQKRLTVEANVEYVRKELTKVWGDNFSDKLAARAKELGESQDELARLAETNPKRFLNLISPRPSNTPFQAPSSTVRSTTGETLKTTQGKTWGDFQKLKKEDPNTYWSIPVQREIHALAFSYAKDGKDFTKT